MKTFTATTIAITIISFSFIIIDATAQPQPTNFSGNWDRNNEKTIATGLSINSVPLKLEISQDNNTVIIKGTNRNGNGDVSIYTDLLKLDGGLTERKAGTDHTKSMSVKWSPEKKELTETAIYKDLQGNITQSFKDIFSLSPDGKSLTIKDERTFNDDQLKGQTYHLICVYNKQ